MHQTRTRAVSRQIVSTNNSNGCACRRRASRRIAAERLPLRLRRDAHVTRSREHGGDQIGRRGSTRTCIVLYLLLALLLGAIRLLGAFLFAVMMRRRRTHCFDDLGNLKKIEIAFRPDHTVHHSSVSLSLIRFVHRQIPLVNSCSDRRSPITATLLERCETLKTSLKLCLLLNECE